MTRLRNLDSIKKEFESKMNSLKEGSCICKTLNESHMLNMAMPEKNCITISLWDWCKEDNAYTINRYIKEVKDDFDFIFDEIERIVY